MLTDTAVKGFKPRDRQYKVADEKGLFLIVRPDGAIWWRFKYRFAGREKQLSMGTYPDTSLKLARDKRDEARRDLAAGVDPSAKRQAEKAAQADTFEAIAREWLGKLTLKRTTVRQLQRRFETYAFPQLGRYPIKTITSSDVLNVLRRIESRGTHETAHRVKSLCGRVFRYAVGTNRAERDVTSDLRDALISVKTRNFPGITNPKRAGELLRALDGYQGQPTVMTALKLAPLVFVRPGELRGARWIEFDFDEEEWRIPAERMKMATQHIVPLSTQAIAILDDFRRLNGSGTLLFPSLRSAERPISDNTLNAALRRLAFAQDEMTTHGFRTMASTLLNEMGFPPDVIELQLAHSDRNKVRDAYNRAERLAERRDMMQQWADYLDGLREK
jgi:integrase